MRRAASRAACTAGSKSATSMPMMAITTSNSTKVNAFFFCMSGPYSVHAVHYAIASTQMARPYTLVCVSCTIRSRSSQVDEA